MITLMAIDYTEKALTIGGAALSAYVAVKVVLTRHDGSIKVNADHIADNKKEIEKMDEKIQQQRIDFTGLDTRTEERGKSIFKELKTIGEDIKDMSGPS